MIYTIDIKKRKLEKKRKVHKINRKLKTGLHKTHQKLKLSKVSTVM